MASLKIVNGHYLIYTADGYSKFLPWHRLHAIEFDAKDKLAKVYAQGFTWVFGDTDDGYKTIENYTKNLSEECKRLI